MRILLLVLLLVSYVQVACAGMKLEAKYPYHLEKQGVHTVYEESTVPIYVNLVNFDNAAPVEATVKITLPQGFEPLTEGNEEKWQVVREQDKTIATTKWLLPEDYGQTFDLLYLEAQEGIALGEKQVLVEAQSGAWQDSKLLSFTYAAGQAAPKEVSKGKKKVDRKKFNWYIQSITFPVDSLGMKDDRAEDGVIYVRDTSLEGFRNRMTGEGATSWSSVFNHPAAHLLLELRNPQSDVRVLKFKAELVDKNTGEIVPGLRTAGKISDDAEQGWHGNDEEKNETTALISLDGNKAPRFILPLYIDYLNILEGEYNLRITISGNGQEKLHEAPVIIAKKHSIGLLAVGFAFACLLIVLGFSYKIKNCIYRVGAKGAITVALFAAIAFGGITLPTTILGDLLHVFLGPFSGLITGLLNGVLHYLLIMSLLMLFRTPGVLSLMFVVKFMLSGLMFGHFSPLGVLSCCVSIVVLEATLYFSGFYTNTHSKGNFMVLMCFLLGLADAFITFVNLEQMMFFYRLYYADWYLALYMLINGVLYSSIGSWLGYKTGMKLRQVMGE